MIDSSHVYDYLVLGAGPAGLQMGYFLSKSDRDYLILERAAGPGAFFAVYPRHRMLISINKLNTGLIDLETNLRWDWNSLLCDDPRLLFKNYSHRYFPDPNDLMQYLSDFAEHFRLKVRYNMTVLRVARSGNRFEVSLGDGKLLLARRVIVATGLSLPYLPPIPGIEGCDTYGSHSINPADYANQRVLIIGKGNSAFETANNLSESAAVIHMVSPNSIQFAWQTHYVGNLRAINNDFLDTYHLKSQNAVIDASINWIRKTDRGYTVHWTYSHANGQTRVGAYDRVIVCTGFRFDPSIFSASARPELTIEDRFPRQTAEWESTNVEGLYFAGTLMQACDFKKTMSGFIHGFRHNIQALSQILEQKYHGHPLPKVTFPASPADVLERVIHRINTAPGLFLQPGFLCDLIVIHDAAGIADYYTDLRKDYIDASGLKDNPHYYTLSLEYGHFGGDPFREDRNPDPEQGRLAAYLHPVIRRYRYGERVSEHHMQDDLENDWTQEENIQPARAYFISQLAGFPSRMPHAS